MLGVRSRRASCVELAIGEQLFRRAQFCRAEMAMAARAAPGPRLPAQFQKPGLPLVQRVPDVVEAPTISAGVLRGARRRRDSLKSSRDQTSSVDVTLGKSTVAFS